MKRKLSTAIIPAIGIFVLIAAAEKAHAGGFELREESAEGMGDAFAGQTAKAYGPNTAYYNPAGMTRLESSSAAQTISLIQPHGHFTGSNTGTPIQGTVSGSDGGEPGKPAVVGSTFSVINVNPDWKIGLAFAVPFGMQTDYKSDWVGRYQALKTKITDYEFQPSVAYRLSDKLSIGGGPRISYMTTQMSNAINQAGFGMGDGTLTMKGDDWGVGYTAGLLYEFTLRTRMGVNYRSQIEYDLSGKVTTQNIHPFLAGAGLTNQNGSLKLTTPDKVNLGIYHELTGNLALVSDISWTRWSVFKSLAAHGDGGLNSSYDYNWRNTWFASLGVDYKINPQWIVRSGVAFDQTPTINSTRDARLPDSNRYWVSAGGSYLITPATSVHFGYSHLFLDKATVNYSANKDPFIGSGTLTGSYNASADLVSVSIATNF